MSAVSEPPETETKNIPGLAMLTLLMVWACSGGATAFSPVPRLRQSTRPAIFDAGSIAFCAGGAKLWICWYDGTEKLVRTYQLQSGTQLTHLSARNTCSASRILSRLLLAQMG